MVVVSTLGVHQNNYLSPEQTERDPAPFAVIRANILARDREAVSNCIGLGEVEAMPTEIAATLPFVRTQQHVSASASVHC